jgi:hypothetical protein
MLSELPTENVSVEDLDALVKDNGIIFISIMVEIATDYAIFRH